MATERCTVRGAETVPLSSHTTSRALAYIQRDGLETEHIRVEGKCVKENMTCLNSHAIYPLLLQFFEHHACNLFRKKPAETQSQAYLNQRISIESNL